MTYETDPGWERRVAELWSAFEEYVPADFRNRMTELAAELPDSHPRAYFERASACDATDLGAEAVTLYQEALWAGLAGEHRRQAVIQLASTLRGLGQPERSIELLTAERSDPSDPMNDAISAFLALALIDVGRERAAAALALDSLARHLPAYNRSVARYAAAVAATEGTGPQGTDPEASPQG
ncbi:tetratricopeptide repeat protein [Streptomyces oceani]|uniref:Tetratrico peptide repeat group 5 domain-containing protein n=1 Tax=Streptomyces oceani TaxID=1075402 RepID=A0A1E7KHD0_9ACTN|nr:tetratricopeptide repeat protein [Streptomyces oceani]OEV03350.1 hypothetical protein AN216_12515 [Streptomyces oceani]